MILSNSTWNLMEWMKQQWPQLLMITWLMMTLTMTSHPVNGDESSSSGLAVTPETQTVRENGIAAFLCRVTGGQGRDLTWFKGGRLLTDRNPKYMLINSTLGLVLRIVPARRRDDGEYMCRASDGAQNLSATGQLKVQEEGRVPPGFPVIRDLATKVIEKNHNDVLQCIVTADPAPTISWLKDYLPVDLTNTRIKSIPGGKLQIERAQESDMGKYECVATNNVGVAHSNAVHVYVKERQVPPQFSRRPEDVNVKPGGSVNLTCVAIGSPMPYVKWLHGVVELTREGSTPPIGINVLRLTNVTESTTYTCEASSTLGVISVQAEVKLKDLPKPPVDVIAVDVTPDSVTLSWDSGNDDVTESYVIRYRLTSSSGDDGYVQVTDVTDSEYTLTELIPHSTYEFHLTAVNSIGTSGPSETIEVTTKESVPGSSPQNVRVRPVSSSTIVVQWDEPTRSNGQIKGYKVFYTLTPELPLLLWKSVDVDNTLITTISSLLTNRTYSVAVLAYTAVGNGPASEAVTIVTQQGVPDQPGHIQATPLSATSIQLTWDPSDSAIGNIDSYEIFSTDVARKRNFTISVVPPRNSFQVDDLSPNTRYRFRVAAKSSRGLGQPSSPVEVATLESAPSAAPQGISGGAIDSTSIRVSWRPPVERDRNGVITGYRVRYGVATEDAVVASVPPSDNSYVMVNLRKWTAYRITVLAHTEHGDGPYSETITVSTAEDVPGEPRRFGLELVNSTTVSLHWRPPGKQEQHGVIRGYQIYYVSTAEDGEQGGQSSIFDVIGENETRVMVGGLRPDTEYQFQIAAYTRKGDGTRSRSKKIRTRAQAPANFRLVLTSSNPAVVVASWDRSDSPRVVGYRLDHRRLGTDSWNQRTLPSDSTRFTLTSDKLLNGIEYEVRLATKSNVDLGDFVSQTIFVPEVVPTGPPLNMRYVISTSSSVRLLWDPPALSGPGSVLYYDVSYRLDDDESEDSVYHRKNSSVTSLVVDNLEKSRDYFFQIAACSLANCGPKSESFLLELVEIAMVTAEDVRATRSSPDEITVAWQRPEVPPSLVIRYVVCYSLDAQLDADAWPCTDPVESLSTVLLDLDPDLTYYVRVRVQLENATFGPFSDVMEVKSSLEVRSDSVREFHASDVHSTSVRLTWSPPKKLGLASYKVHYDVRHHHDNGSVVAMPTARRELEVPRDSEMVTIDDLKPGTAYAFSIVAKFFDGDYGPSKSTTAKTYASIGAPVLESRDPDSFVRFRLLHEPTPSESTTSNVTFFLLVVVVAEDLAKRRNPDSFSLPELDAMDEGSSQPFWIAAKYRSDEVPEAVDIGDDNFPGTGEYRNRPLSADRPYRIFVRRVFSDQRFISSPYSADPTSDVLLGAASPEESESDLDLLWVVAPICAAVVVLLLVVLVVVFLRRSRRARRTKRLPVIESPLLFPVKGSAYDPMELSHLKPLNQGLASHPAIMVQDLARHVDELKENDHQKFSHEYESIEPGQQFTWDASNQEVNKSKNRYANVIAYDHSRVTLQPLDGVPGSDYINANFIDGQRENAYIATQGPLPETFGDFWRMIWEQRCQTIVMMTKLEERNRVKCDQYWPNRGTDVYGLMQVTTVDVIELASYTVRTFIVTKNNSFEKREVRQFQFTAWPDHGVPDHPTPLLTFIRRVKAVSAADVGPTVIHCSAGVGRTGAFIVIDTMLDRLKQHDNTIDIYGYVTCLRAQRNYMVQTEDQYIFIHEALLEAVESGNTEIPADNLYAHIQSLTKIDPERGVSRMELQFKKLADMKLDSTEYLSGSLPVNKMKNRLVNILPYDSTRVCLQSIRGVEGSDYINASYIDGYRNRRSYIATQGPFAETTDDFWRLLWENNSTIVVMLTKLREMGREKCHAYWPEERSARYQYFVVDPVGQYTMPQFILREFKVTDARDGQSRMIRHFQFMDWPEQGVPSSGEGFIEFIGHIQKTREQVGQDGPIIVHCSTGFGRTGVFLTLSIVLEQMRYEAVVDMFQTVKMLRTQRPVMVQTEDQYTFCYRAALEYLSSFDHYAS